MNTDKLDGLLNKKFSDLEEFRQNQKEVWQVVDVGYLVCEGLIMSAVTIPELTMIETHRVMMWWTVLDYQMQGFFLCIDRQLDLALASLRMASELTRDIAQIDNDETKLNTWLNRIDPKIKKQYRKEFQFNDSDNLERYVHKLYDLASTFGTHFHMLRSSSMRPVKSAMKGKYVVLDVPDLAVFKVLEIWLAAFYPLQAVCSRRFVLDRKNQLAIPYGHFQSVWDAFNPIFDNYRKNLRDQDADVIGPLH